MNAIKIWRVNDYEWWAGESLESIRGAYQNATGIDPDGDEGFDAPREARAEEMGKMVTWDDAPTREQSTITFQELLNEMIATGKEFPCYFAGTEC